MSNLARASRVTRIGDAPRRPALKVVSNDDPSSRAPRSSRLFESEVITTDGRYVRVMVRNISSGGLGGRSDAALRVGERVQILVPVLGPLGGVIAWMRNGLFGLALDDPIDPGDIRFAQPTPRERYVVPLSHIPFTDCRRPGVRTR